MLRKFLKKKPRKPLSRQVNGLFEELEPRVLYSASPLGLPPEALVAAETIQIAPPGADHVGEGTATANGNDAAAGNGIGPAKAGFEQIRATIDGIEHWPLDPDLDSDDHPVSTGDTGEEDLGASSLLPGSEESSLFEFEETNRFWVQDDESILEAGLNTWEDFSALLPEVEDSDTDLSDVAEPPVVNVEKGEGSFSIYHEEGPRNVLESVDRELPEIQGAEDVATLPLVQLTTLELV